MPPQLGSSHSHRTKAQLVRELRLLSDRVTELEAQGQAEKHVLQTIAAGTSQVGPGFFSSFVRSLASALGVRYAFVAECLDRPTTKVRTLAFWMGDHLGENVEYEIDGTPCKNVLDGTTQCYPCDIQKLFPADKDLVSLRAESYCGSPLHDTCGRIIGHLAVLNVDKLPQNFCDIPSVRIFAARAAAELERKQAEAEKMAALSQFTAGIAHELNTPIGVVKSSAFNIERCITKIVRATEKNQRQDGAQLGRDVHRSLDIIQDNSGVISDASSRIARIVSGLKRFSVEELSEESANVRVCAESALSLISQQVSEEIAITTKFGEVPAVRCGPAALHQVLVTLLTNAGQAIRGPGRITVETDRNEDCAQVRISDSGRGITKDKLATLFDFTFTTIGSRVGVGMGLASAYNIVHRCNGDITVASEVGKGTTFTITLPFAPSAS